MSLRLKYGLIGVRRMSVVLDSSVSSVVKNALVEGDWLYISSVGAVSGMSTSGSEFIGKPVNTTARRNSFPIICNPQSPENSVPGVGLTVACEVGFIGYTDRYDTALSTYVDATTGGAPLVAKSFSVGGVTRYGLTPAAAPGSSGDKGAEDDFVVAYAIAVYNSELVFRFIP